jgi:asparagine synthase (glutamine-hydrolysing)
MSFRDGSIWIVFNGEIYNCPELRAELEQKGYHFATRTDTEVILKAYAEFGKSCFERLWGMFAIGLWDANIKTLFLARDRFGKKPLYYSHQDGRFAFASELKALKRVPFVSREPDYEAIDEYFAYGYICAPRSILRMVRKVRPAHVLTVRGDSIQEDPYWKLPVVADPQPVHREEVLERLRTLLGDAVRRRMISDVPLGAFLSGGIDSSLIVAMMAEQSSGRVKTFSIGFESQPYDETPFARQVAERFDTDHTGVTFQTPCDTLIEKVLRQFDEPFGDVSALPTAFLSEITHRRVKVALSGDGGDEVFGGYDLYEDMLNRSAHKIAAPIRALAGAASRLLPPELRGAGRLRACSLGNNVDELFVDRSSVFAAQLRHKLLSTDVRRSLDGHTAEDVKRTFLKNAGQASTLRRLQCADIQHYLADDILVKVDRMSMWHSLEVRSPLLDHRIVQFAFGLPDEWIISGGERKHPLKELVRQYFPPGFVERRKQGFTIPLREWFCGNFGALFEHYVLHGRISAIGWLDMMLVDKLYRSHRSGYRNFSGLLWCLLAFGVWCEQSGE